MLHKGDQLLPGVQQRQKVIKTRQTALDRPLAPMAHPPQSIRFRTIGGIPIIRAHADQPHQSLQVFLPFGGRRHVQPVRLLFA